MPEFVDPNKILNELNLEKGMVACDFGSGSGGWTIPLAQKLARGRVFAVDIQKTALSALEGKAKLYGILNIKCLIANIEEKIEEIKNESCDLVLITDLLFQVDDKNGVFKEAFRILKPEGKVLLVEWKPEAPFGPKDSRPSKEETTEIAKNNGFEIEKEILAGDFHYGVIFIKH